MLQVRFHAGDGRRKTCHREAASCAMHRMFTVKKQQTSLFPPLGHTPEPCPCRTPPCPPRPGASHGPPSRSRCCGLRGRRHGPPGRRFLVRAEHASLPCRPRPSPRRRLTLRLLPAPPLCRVACPVSRCCRRASERGAVCSSIPPCGGGRGFCRTGTAAQRLVVCFTASQQ